MPLPMDHKSWIRWVALVVERWKDTPMPYQPIENYGIIGNMHTVALVGMNGSIDWYSYPHFDSPSIFGAILDDNRGGRFQICPVGDQVRHKQFYWPSTNILVTRFLLPDGIAELEDFMPVGLAADVVVDRDLDQVGLRQLEQGKCRLNRIVPITSSSVTRR